MSHHLRPALGVAGVVVFAMLLIGCSSQTSPDLKPAPPPSESPSLGPTDHENPIDDPVIATPAEASAQSQEDAIAAATTVMEAFAQPELDADAWWREMLPLLSQEGAYAHEGTDPARIPVTSITGAGEILDGSTEVSLIVRIPTNAGLYHVTLTRPDTSSPWLAERIRPAQG